MMKSQRVRLFFPLVKLTFVPSSWNHGTDLATPNVMKQSPVYSHVATQFFRSRCQATWLEPLLDTVFS